MPTTRSPKLAPVTPASCSWCMGLGEENARYELADDASDEAVALLALDLLACGDTGCTEHLGAWRLARGGRSLSLSA